MDATATIQQYQPLVKWLAAKFAFTHPLIPLDTDDLIAVGNIGVWQASQRYQPRPGISFTAYVHAYVRGEIRDAWRRAVWLPRSEQRPDAKVRQVISLESTASADDGTFTFHDVIPAPESQRPFECVDLHSAIQWALDQLPVRQCLLIRLYYWRGLSLTKIASMLGVSKPRAAQLHQQALHNLRKILVGWDA